VIGFVELALLSLSYYYFTRILFRFIFPAFEGRNFLIYFIIAAVGLAYLSFQSNNTQVLFHIPVLLWLVIYTLLVSQEQFIINHFKVTMTALLFWIFIFSVSLAAVILEANQEKEWVFRKSLAEKQHELTDPSQARTVKIATWTMIFLPATLIVSPALIHTLFYGIVFLRIIFPRLTKMPIPPKFMFLILCTRDYTTAIHDRMLT
jgi:hypothetical protein